MDDDQWLSRGGQRQRPTGGNPGQNPGQRPGPSRPPNVTGSASGRPSGGVNASGGAPYNSAVGNSRPVQRPGNSGPLQRGPVSGVGTNGRSSNNYSHPAGGATRSGTVGPGDRRSGSVGNQGRGGWDEDESQWQSGGNSRPSRSLNQPQGRSGSSTQSGRGAQTGQWNNSQRGWDDEDDDPKGGRGRQGRAPSGQVGPGARGAQGRPGAPQKGQGRSGNVTVRGNWVVENDAKGGSSSTSNPLRRRLLMLLLVVVVVLGGAVALVPSVRQKVQCYLPGANCPKPNTQTNAPATPGSLIVQVNVPNATVKVDAQQQTTQAGQTAPFSTATFKNLPAGKHTLTIHADKYADYSGPLTLAAAGATVTAWLAPAADALTALGTQFGTPAMQPDAGKAGDHYSPTQTANGALTVGVSYTLGGLNPSPFTDQLAQTADTQTSPFKPVTLTLTPVFTFKNAAGTTLLATDFTALPATQFGVSVIPTVDAKGTGQLSAQGVVLTAGGQPIKTTFAGPAASDYALYFAIASVFTTAPAALNLTCIGAVDNQKFNPEDGLFIVDTTDDTAHAHYFYRWGTLWATNAVAHQLTPNAPMAQAGSNEFNDANTAIANKSCGN